MLHSLQVLPNSVERTSGYPTHAEVGNGFLRAPDLAHNLEAEAVHQRQHIVRRSVQRNPSKLFARDRVQLRGQPHVGARRHHAPREYRAGVDVASDRERAILIDDSVLRPSTPPPENGARINGSNAAHTIQVGG